MIGGSFDSWQPSKSKRVSVKILGMWYHEVGLLIGAMQSESCHVFAGCKAMGAKQTRLVLVAGAKCLIGSSVMHP